MKTYKYKCSYVVLFDTAQAVCDFKPLSKSVHYVLLDRSGSDNQELDKRIEYFKSNGIDYLRFDPDCSIAYCYNESLSYIKGEYVCFTNQYVSYLRCMVTALNIATRKYPGSNLVSINYRKPSGVDFRKHIHEYSMKKSDQNHNQKILTFLPAVFVRTGFIGDTRFSDVCEEETAAFFLMSLWKKDSTIVTFEKLYCYHDNVFLSLKSDEFYGCNNKDFYIKSLRENFLPFLREYSNKGENIPNWLARFVYFRLYFKYYANFNHRHKFLLNDEEIKEFFELTTQVLRFIPDDVFFNNEKFEQFVPPFALRNFLMYLKYDGDMQKLNRRFYFDGNKLYFAQADSKYNMALHKGIMLKAFNLRHGKLSIDMRCFTYMLYEYAQDAITVEVNGKVCDIVKNDIYSLDKVFSLSIEKGYTFSVDIPLDEVLKDGAQIAVYMELNGEKQLMPIEFSRTPSKLNHLCPHSYWRMNDEYTMVYENSKLVVKKYSDSQLKEREKLYLKEIPSALKPVCYDVLMHINTVITARRIRKAYFKRKDEFKGRRIWLYFDKLYKAGDNGEYAFRHAMTRDDGIEHYYIVNKDSLDYDRLKSEFPDNILEYGTIDCQLYGLLCENIVATHPDIIEFVGIDSKVATVVKDLFAPNLICIAHGITIQKNADYQNRLYDNTMFYTTSSKYEVEHILKPAYNYREDEVALTGLARFDGLKNNDQKQILITPTWRRSIVGEAQRNSTREYSNSFKKTSYYKIYNSLINDKRIIDVARSTGYRVIFLLHPAMSTQINDYDRNDYVELVQASGDLNYEKILTESSLMITDYSGIHYDFSYMRKPIIYYQPKEVPMRFEEGGMKFDTMAFGPVCTEYEDAVSLICEYMQNECKMPLQYKKRADDFFAFDDFNSSQRIYDAILKWTDERKNYETKTN